MKPFLSLLEPALKKLLKIELTTLKYSVIFICINITGSMKFPRNYEDLFINQIELRRLHYEKRRFGIISGTRCQRDAFG